MTYATWRGSCGYLRILLLLALTLPTCDTMRTTLSTLEVYGEVPAFTLTDHTGTPFGTANLEGRIWVVDFIFTTCPGICPRLSAAMSRLQSALAAAYLAERVQLVSITVDPDFDTPEVLAQYAQRYDSGETPWSFLTGDKQDIYTLIREGFTLGIASAGTDSLAQTSEPITHSVRLVLVDAQGRIRAYHDGLDSATPATIVQDIRQLL